MDEQDKLDRLELIKEIAEQIKQHELQQIEDHELQFEE